MLFQNALLFNYMKENNLIFFDWLCFFVYLHPRLRCSRFLIFDLWTQNTNVAVCVIVRLFLSPNRNFLRVPTDCFEIYFCGILDLDGLCNSLYQPVHKKWEVINKNGVKVLKNGVKGLKKKIKFQILFQLLALKYLE